MYFRNLISEVEAQATSSSISLLFTQSLYILPNLYDPLIRCPYGTFKALSYLSYLQSGAMRVFLD